MLKSISFTVSGLGAACISLTLNAVANCKFKVINGFKSKSHSLKVRSHVHLKWHSAAKSINSCGIAAVSGFTRVVRQICQVKLWLTMMHRCALFTNIKLSCQCWVDNLLTHSRSRPTNIKHRCLILGLEPQTSQRRADEFRDTNFCSDQVLKLSVLTVHQMKASGHLKNNRTIPTRYMHSSLPRSNTYFLWSNYNCTFWFVKWNVFLSGHK